MAARNGYFLVKFDIPEDQEKVISGGPRMLNSHYLAMKRWSQVFNLAEECFGHTMVWICFSCLNQMYYKEGEILTIVAVVEKPMKVDLTTKNLNELDT